MQNFLWSQKVEVRIRKFNNLPATSEYKDEKYRAALTESLMSPDEDEVDDANKKTGRFISHAATYRSTLVSTAATFINETLHTFVLRCPSS
jgi:hypothetical protein